jgi:hypothetical protein
VALLGALLAACGARPELAITSARIAGGDNPALEAGLELALGPTLGEALARGIPLTLVFELEAEDHDALERRLMLRYLPLAERWQLVDLDTGSARSFARRTQLLAALDSVRLPLDPEWVERGGPRYALSVRLDRDALPGTLRLSARVAPAWRLASEEYRWIAAG